MANNKGGAIIPYQPTYSIQYKYGDRYGGQNFAKPTTAINTGQAGGPLSAQATLDEEEATQTIVNPTTTATSGDGETLDSKAEGAPGGTGGAEFSELVAQYTPAQPDFGWQYAHNYGDDPYTDPPVSDIFDPPEVPPESGFGVGIIDDGGEHDHSSNPDSKDMGLETDVPAQEEITYGNPGVGNEVGVPVDTSIDDVGSEEDPDTDPVDTSIDDVGSEEDPDTGGGYDNNTGQGDSYDHGLMNAGGLVPAFGMKKRNRDIPNPIFQDPLADYFRRA